MSQCYSYDYLRRMTEAWAQSDTTCASAPSAGVLDVTSEYAYPADGQPQPRALSQVTTGTDTDTYTWDRAGNLETRTVDGKTETFTWNAQGRPTQIDSTSGTAKMYYSDDGDRIARIDADGTVTAYVAGHEVTRAAGSGAAKATRYYMHGDEVVAIRAAGQDLSWMASDHHGTADWSVNSVTMVASVKRRDPFGNVRMRFNPDIWSGGQHGFVGGTEDPSGLVQLGARPYDPKLGMFIAVDPLMTPTAPQSLNPYAYANNAPATASDPSGLTSCSAAFPEFCASNPPSGGGSGKNKGSHGGPGGCGGSCTLPDSGSSSAGAPAYPKGMLPDHIAKLPYRSPERVDWIGNFYTHYVQTSDQYSPEEYEQFREAYCHEQQHCGGGEGAPHPTRLDHNAA